MRIPFSKGAPGGTNHPVSPMILMYFDDFGEWSDGAPILMYVVDGED